MVGRITHDWYQTETQVVIEIRIKKLAADMVKVDIGDDTSLSVTAKLPGSEYRIQVRNAGLILDNTDHVT